jgi:DNA-binding CsgD family transcriptional regulator
MNLTPEEADRTAIMQVIETEGVAYLQRDYETWAGCYVQAPHVRRLGSSGLKGVYSRGGWQDYAARMKQFMAANPSPSTVEYRREAINFSIGSDMAWVTFDQIASRGSGWEFELPEATHEVWIMEKGVGGWKVACICVLVRSLEHVASALVRVDRSGAVVWMNAAAETELRESAGLVVRAGRLRAANRTADQRLQAAFGWAGHVDEGVWPRRGTLPVILEGGRGEAARICWVIARNGQILVAITDRQMTEERLAAAAAVYGITQAQARVAALIVAGHDTVSAARELGVSVNTARTHLQRMFEKTGVRSQPALVRALLSVASPIG